MRSLRIARRSIGGACQCHLLPNRQFALTSGVSRRCGSRETHRCATRELQHSSFKLRRIRHHGEVPRGVEHQLYRDFVYGGNESDLARDVVH